MDRTRVLDVVLREVSLAHPDAPLFAVEVGCMFSDEQGRSTSTIADSLAGRAAGGRLVTIDCVVRAETLDLPSVSNEEFALPEGHDQHRMLVYGAPRVVAVCEQEFGNSTDIDVKPDLAHDKRRG